MTVLESTLLGDALLFLVPWLHVFISPYAKVEEDFNLHATHDLLMYGIHHDTLHNFDHFPFPTPVPRSFIGSLVLSYCSLPLIRLAHEAHLIISKFDLQIIVRLTLATLNSLALLYVRRAVSRRFTPLAGSLFAYLTVTQFHLPYWQGRTIPNMFALLPVNISTALLIRGSKRGLYTAIALLTFCTVVFRAELAPLLAFVTLQSLVTKRAGLGSVIKTGILAGVLSLVLTVVIDSFFWRQFFLWPEFSGVLFNVYEGKSAEWGVSPPYEYFIIHLPKLLMVSTPLSALAFIFSRKARSLLIAPIAFIGAMSCLGHKEWRFIVYVVPVFNVAAACTARWIWSQRGRNILLRLMSLGLLGLFATNIVATAFLTYVSSINYPGGMALQMLHEIVVDSPATIARVYIDNYAAHTGATLFLYLHSPPHLSLLAPEHGSAIWSYDRGRHNRTDFGEFTYVISEDWERWGAEWEVLAGVEAFAGVEFGRAEGGGRVYGRRRWGKLEDWLPRVVVEERLWILQRRDEAEQEAEVEESEAVGT
ncbi:glycosyltransferase family 22 protein [Botryobasidium botryosum FD-172 SS1]|uniref:Mannosyltransferase n=1 Tax=Botryobasidium botryosum (strain FD-172 SS1) TaxID=930990 RepID=A0A067M1Y5_BOTB1|nr:glycosyltransferase family 22 protein [Botryobasidium botryosum FD-172 SS1]